jgi:SHS2 domain-containing protein
MGNYKVDIVNDIEIEVSALSIVDLLNTLISAFNSILIDGKRCRDFEKELEFENDFPDFFVDFFNELIYLFETEGFIAHSVCNFSKNGKIKLKLSGMIFDNQKHKVKRVLKSATYHNLEFRNDNGYYVKMIIDI